MKLVTISKELNLAEADLKVARLDAANFHPVLQNESSALYLGTAVGAGGFLIQVPEDEAESAKEFLASPVTLEKPLE